MPYHARIVRSVLAICLLIFAHVGLAEERPEKWATPLELAGVPNLHKVSDELYRGAQPSAEGMQSLKDFGINTIINLRSIHSDRDEIGSLDLTYKHIRMTALTPDEKDILRFLHIVTDPANTPVFVHCQHGADRTGLMSAIYRIVIQGWTKADAIEEMTDGGFGFHRIFWNLVWFLENLDVEALKQKIRMNEQ